MAIVMFTQFNVDNDINDVNDINNTSREYSNYSSYNELITGADVILDTSTDMFQHTTPALTTLVIAMLATLYINLLLHNIVMREFVADLLIIFGVSIIVIMTYMLYQM